MEKNKGKFILEIDENEVHKVIKEEVKANFDKTKELNKIFYTMKELSYLTGLSESAIYKYMFTDPRLPKRKVGRKWLFKAELMNEFLNNWIDEFPDN